MQEHKQAGFKHHPDRSGLQQAGALLHAQHPELIVSKQKLRQADAVQMVRMKRETATQNLGFASRPFVLCGLPVKRPPAGSLLHERRNGKFVLQVTGHPEYGLPWGQDRLVPIFLAMLAIRQQSQTISFASAAEMLDTFGMQQGGAQYRRLIEAFKRVFGATIFFGTDTQPERARVIQQTRFSFMSEARIWYVRHVEQPTLPGDCRKTIVLSAEFFREIMDHPIPTDLEAAKALSSAPAALDLFTWLSYRCFVAKAEERVPLFGAFGLASQLGSREYARPRRFREKLEFWLQLVRAMWPSCPAKIDPTGRNLIVAPAAAVYPAIRDRCSVLLSGDCACSRPSMALAKRDDRLEYRACGQESESPMRAGRPGGSIVTLTQSGRSTSKAA